ncbi:MAG: hypothetical protein ACHQK9_24840 [Reyranellales bacterium]
MRHFLVGALMFGFGVISTSFAANALELWAISHQPHYDPEPDSDVAEIRPPSSLGRDAQCPTLRSGPVAPFKLGTSPRK